MKRDIPTQAGVGFTIFVAAATFAIAVVAGIFLVYQSETTLGSNVQLRTLAQAQMSLAEAPPPTPNSVIPPPASTPAP